MAWPKGKIRPKKIKPPPPPPPPIRCLFCESFNVDPGKGECVDCGTASAEMLAKMWTGKSRMRPLSRTMSAQGAVYAQHVNYSGPNRFSGG